MSADIKAEIGGINFHILEASSGLKLEIHGYFYYDELCDQDVKDLIHFLTTHFGAPRD